MKDNNNNYQKNNPAGKIEYYFLRKSAESFAADLNNFAKEAQDFSNEQLYAIMSFCDHIRENMANVKSELERRSAKETLEFIDRMPFPIQ